MIIFIYLYNITVIFYTNFFSECTDKRYGPECRNVCQNCLNGEQCHHVNGSCPNGCDKGTYGDNCDIGI